jgi:hypothetical protein
VVDGAGDDLLVARTQEWSQSRCWADTISALRLGSTGCPAGGDSELSAWTELLGTNLWMARNLNGSVASMAGPSVVRRFEVPYARTLDTGEPRS